MEFRSLTCGSVVYIDLGGNVGVGWEVRNNEQVLVAWAKKKKRANIGFLKYLPGKYDIFKGKLQGLVTAFTGWKLD